MHTYMQIFICICSYKYGLGNKSDTYICSNQYCTEDVLSASSFSIDVQIDHYKL